MKVGLFVNKVTDYTKPVFESLSKRVDLRVYVFRGDVPDPLQGQSFRSISAGGYWISDAPMALSESHDILIAGGLNYFTTQIVSSVVELTDTPLIVWTDEWVATQTSFRHRILRPIKRSIISHSDGYIACGSPQAAFVRLLGAPQKDITIARYSPCTIPERNAWSVPPEIDEEFFSRPTALYLGRLVERKGILDLINLFEEDGPNDETDWQLLIAGTGPLSNQVYDRCQKLPRIKIIPRYVSHAEKAWLLANATVTCLPSRAEPWGIIMPESLSVNTPVIASNEVAAAIDHISDGHNGFIVPPGDEQAVKEALSAVNQLDMDHSHATAPVAGCSTADQAEKFYKQIKNASTKSSL